MVLGGDVQLILDVCGRARHKFSSRSAPIIVGTRLKRPVPKAVGGLIVRVVPLRMGEFVAPVGPPEFARTVLTRTLRRQLAASA